MSVAPGQRQFQCEHCQGLITIPANLPPTTAPCPMCGQSTTSPGPEQAPLGQQAPVQQAPVQQAEPTPSPEIKPEPEVLGQKGEGRGAGLLWGLAGVALLGLLAGGYYMVTKMQIAPASGGGLPGTTSTMSDGSGPSPQELSETQKIRAENKAATEALDNFLAARTAEDRAKWVIGGEGKVEQIRNFYGRDKYEFENLKSENFAIFPMGEVDRARGIMMMDYVRPRQFKLEDFFRPIATMELQLKVETPGIHIWSGALEDSFQMEAQRVRVFLKKVDGKYLIDWDTLVQTQFRLLRDFANNPIAGNEGEFRVFIVEDVTSTLKKSDVSRVYRIADPAHSLEDQVTVEINRDSEVGQILEEIAWTDKEGLGPDNGRLATLRLSWSSDTKPVIQIEEFICWEFLGVGGERGNHKEARK